MLNYYNFIQIQHPIITNKFIQVLNYYNFIRECSADPEEPQLGLFS